MTLTPDQVKAGRELAGWSRLRLAARVNVCDETIRRYERGGRAAATLDLMMVRQILNPQASSSSPRMATNRG